jgi:hypothetical protein
MQVQGANLVLTMENLRKWRVIVVYWCCMCREVERLWIIFFSIVKLLVLCGVLSSFWVMLRRVVDLFACWRGLRGSPQCAVVWKMIPSYPL